MNFVEIGLWVAGMAVLVVQRVLLGNRAQVWLGAILPVAWLITGAVLLSRGHSPGFRSWLAVAAGLVLLLGFWVDGQAARKKRLDRENDRIDALNEIGHTDFSATGRQAN